MNREHALKDIRVIGGMTLIIMAFLIIIPMILIKTPLSGLNPFSLNSDSVKYKKGDGIYVEGKDVVKVYNTTTKKIEEIELEDYVIGVVAAEMPANFEVEALKAQSVAARTYYFSKRLNPCTQGNGAEICNSTHCQAYITKEDRISKWASSEAEANWQKISDAVNGTKGQVLVYDGEILKYPQFFSTSSGKTESSIDVFASDVPYLKSVESPGEEISNRYEILKNIPLTSFVDTINNKYSDAKVTSGNIKNEVVILSKTEGGAVKEIKLGNKTIKGTEFRTLFSLNSANFTIDYSGSEVIIKCMGYGHGLGMSQWGANVMGKAGSKYDDILLHYYTDVDIELVKYKG